jgi:ATP-dependent DNA helicase PcrA (EC 3.6.1.-)
MCEKHRNLCVVGDDDQSIYGFRGAEVSNILEFEQRFPDARIITLSRNYRSTENILKAANAVINRNINRRQKELWSKLGEGQPIEMGGIL